MTPLQIDIPSVLREKAPSKQFPAFVVHWLERIVHVREMNEFLSQYGTLEGLDFVRVYLKEGLHCSASIEGREHIPLDNQPFLFVSNHPLGGLDGLILALLIGETRNRPIRLIVNDLLLFLKPIAGLFVPVNKVGAQSRKYAEMQQALWKSDMDIISFPAGACSRWQYRKHEGFTIHDLEWKKSFVRHAVSTQRDVVPIYFEGTNSTFFYQLAFWRKHLGIRTNIEMLYLADEMYKASGKHFVVRVGQPIPYTKFDKSRSSEEWAEWVQDRVYDLRKA